MTPADLAAEGLLLCESEEEFEDGLRDLLAEALGLGFGLRSFEEAGVLALNRGLVLRLPSAEFQLTIVKSS